MEDEAKGIWSVEAQRYGKDFDFILKEEGSHWRIVNSAIKDHSVIISQYYVCI